MLAVYTQSNMIKRRAGVGILLCGIDHLFYDKKKVAGTMRTANAGP
jgi:hypothetical protein